MSKDILIVEPHRRTADTLVLRMTARGYTARSAATPGEAEDAMQRRRPDLMIVGLGLPQDAPKALCDRLRGMPGGALVPILLLDDGSGAISTQREAIALGADRLFKRPAEMATLIETAASLVGPGPAPRPSASIDTQTDADREAEASDETLDFSSLNALIWSDPPGDLRDRPASFPPFEDATEISLDDADPLADPPDADFDSLPGMPLTDLPSIDFASLAERGALAGYETVGDAPPIESADFASLNVVLHDEPGEPDEAPPRTQPRHTIPPSFAPAEGTPVEWAEPAESRPPVRSARPSARPAVLSRPPITPAAARPVTPPLAPAPASSIVSPIASAPVPRPEPVARHSLPPEPVARHSLPPDPLPERPGVAYRPPAAPVPEEEARWAAVIQPGRAIPLTRRGLGGLLIGMARLRRTGRVEVTAGGALRRVFFDAGRPVFFDSSASGEDLGAWLATEGQVTRGALASARTQAAQLGVPPEEVLIEQGFVSSEQVYRALAAHVSERIIALFGLESGTSLVVQGGPRPVDPVDLGAPIERIVLDGIRRKYGRLRLYRSFGTPVVVPRPSANPPTVPLRVDEQAALDAVDGRRSVADIAQAVRMAEPDALAVLHGLALAGFIDPPAAAGQGTLPPLDAALIARAHGPQSADALPGFAEQVHAKLAVIDAGDYFAVLDVPSQATGAEIEAAYSTLRRRFDPHRVAAGPLAEQVREIADVLGDAFAILSDPRRRARYAEALTRRPAAEAAWRYSKS